MPAILPAIAGFGAATWGVSVGFTMFGMGVFATSIAVGAIAGAVVGGLTAAITGGDIGEGLLYGAVGGAVGGALGGYFGPELFGSSGVELASSGTGGSSSVMDVGSFMAEGGNAFGGTSATISSGVSAGSGGASAGGGLLSNDMLTYGLISGGAQMFSGAMTEEPYASSEEGVTSTQKTQKEINDANLAQRAAEAKQQNEQFYANLDRQQTELNKTLEQRKYEADLPYAQAEAARQRQRETASGLTLTRKQEEANALRTPTEQQQELNQFIYG